MRDFFIKGLEVMIGVIVVIIGLGIVITAGTIMFSGSNGLTYNGAQINGPVAGLGVLIGGAIYLIFVGGFMYLGLGIYQNTRRTAEAVERLANSQR